MRVSQLVQRNLTNDKLTSNTISPLSAALPQGEVATGEVHVARASIPDADRDTRVMIVVKVLRDAPGTPVGDGRPRAVFNGSALPCGCAPTV